MSDMHNLQVAIPPERYGRNGHFGGVHCTNRTRARNPIFLRGFARRFSRSDGTCPTGTRHFWRLRSFSRRFRRSDAMRPTGTRPFLAFAGFCASFALVVPRDAYGDSYGCPGCPNVPVFSLLRGPSRRDGAQIARKGSKETTKGSIRAFSLPDFFCIGFGR